MSNSKIAIVALGYVGLPLSLQLANNCVAVIGLYIDADKIALLCRGLSEIRHIPSPGINATVNN